MRYQRNFTTVRAFAVAYLLVSGCATTTDGGEGAIHNSVFGESANNWQFAKQVEKCREKPTEECRKNVAKVVKAHIDVAKIAQPESKETAEKTFDMINLGGTVAAPLVKSGGKTAIAAGLAVIAGVEQIFDIGEDTKSDLNSIDVWEKISARLHMPLDDYPVDAVLADLDEYREVLSEE